jgi:hypothetical protein
MMMNFNRRRTLPSSSTSLARPDPCLILVLKTIHLKRLPILQLPYCHSQLVIFLQNMVITVILPTMVVKVLLVLSSMTPKFDPKETMLRKSPKLSGTI